MVDKPTAVVRKEIVTSTGPSIYGINRMDKVRSPRGEVFTFLGVCDGIAYLEREVRTAEGTFVELDSSDFSKYKRIE
jgi:hypothetical protein